MAKKKRQISGQSTSSQSTDCGSSLLPIVPQVNSSSSGMLTASSGFVASSFLSSAILSNLLPPISGSQVGLQPPLSTMPSFPMSSHLASLVLLLSLLMPFSSASSASVGATGDFVPNVGGSPTFVQLALPLALEGLRINGQLSTRLQVLQAEKQKLSEEKQMVCEQLKQVYTHNDVLKRELCAVKRQMKKAEKAVKDTEINNARIQQVRAKETEEIKKEVQNIKAESQYNAARCAQLKQEVGKMREKLCQQPQFQKSVFFENAFPALSLPQSPDIVADISSSSSSFAAPTPVCPFPISSNPQSSSQLTSIDMFLWGDSPIQNASLHKGLNSEDELPFLNEDSFGDGQSLAQNTPSATPM